MNTIKTNAAGFAEQTIEVNTKKDGKYVPVGKISIFIPTLESFGIEAEQGEAEDGLPTYKDDKLQYLHNAVIAAVKAKARNALQPGTAELKPGLSIADNFEALLAEGVRGGGAEALAAVREFKAGFMEWFATQGKAANVVAAIKTLIDRKESLALQSAANKAKVSAYISEWAEQADASLLERAGKYIQGLLDACEMEEMGEL